MEMFKGQWVFKDMRPISSGRREIEGDREREGVQICARTGFAYIAPEQHLASTF